MDAEPVNLEVKPLDETYSEEFLTNIEAMPPVELGWYRSHQDDRDYLYADRVENLISDTILTDPIHELQPVVRRAPVSGIKRKFSRAKRTGSVLDQELTPQCVAFSGSSVKIEQERREHRRTLTPDPHEWYDRAKEVDPWGPSVEGTDIKSASKVALNRGVYMTKPKAKEAKLYPISNYVKLTSVEQIIDAVQNKGTVWFGITVDRGIFAPVETNAGFVIPAPSGQEVGGHAMAITGFWLDNGWLEIKNSWGTSWGDKGYAWMPLNHFSSYPDWDAWATLDKDDVGGR